MTDWQTIAANKRRALADSIPAEWRIPASQLPPETQDKVVDWPSTSGFFTARELEMTSLSATELLSRLGTGTWSSEEVTRAHCKRAAAGQQLVRFLSELFGCFPHCSLYGRCRPIHNQQLDRHLKTTKPYTSLFRRAT